MKNKVVFVLSGEAGQGLQTVEDFITLAAVNKYHIFSTKEFMSRIRGGNNTVSITFSSEPVYANRDRIDYLFLLNNDALSRVSHRISADTKVFGESYFSGKTGEASFFDLSLNSLSKEIGILYSNTVLFGIIAGILGLSGEVCRDILSMHFSKKGNVIISNNHKAFDIGFAWAMTCGLSIQISPKKENVFKVKDCTEGIGIGALAGGCDFIASYPMSPGTGVLVYLSSKSEHFGVVVEQAEDEIAALNMAIGAWYAGARAMVTTSGGGFALMEEALSLSGITETPCVVHIAQRPGPATGLPTRTEQADLNLAVYAGHGEFPRIIYAPGDFIEAVLLTQLAFYNADLYQVPAIILTDQYLLDSRWEYIPFTPDVNFLERQITETLPGYARYAFTDNGVSPRGIPGFGSGSVKCDSDEHDENGLITEDNNTRTRMNEKRLAKEKLLVDNFIQPDIRGKGNIFIIGWGSTKHVIAEAIQEANIDAVQVHFSQVWPLPDNLFTTFETAEKIIVVENNATGQISRLLEHSGIIATDLILQYDGMPFSVETLSVAIKEAL